ncbi:MAG: DUF4115 domain-containing protein [Burkholderiales bacterium]|nr:DUF4115 domain-containing protein [Burkholderiales bacterium]
MSTEDTPSVAPAPGEQLRAAREAAQWTREDVAAKLKLSVRQISAMESGDWSALPERTFTRGFLRNYARLLGLDPDSVGIEQSAAQATPATELKPTPIGIGEVAPESDNGPRNGAARWAVPTLLIAVIIAGGAYYHFSQGTGAAGGNVPAAPAPGATPPEAATAAPAPATPDKGAAATTPAPGAIDPTRTANVISPPAPTVPDTPPPSAPTASADRTPAAPATTLPAPAPAVKAGERRITLVFKGKSWTEVRSKGEVIFSETAQPGTREFVGALPLSFVVGNASNVSVTIDGKPWDLTDLTRNDVARFRVE